MKQRLGIFVTHPIQYFAPLWRELSRAEDLGVRVHFFSDASIRGGVDPGFGVPVAWDQPLLEGYEHVFLSREANLDSPDSFGIPDALSTLREGAFTSVLVHGHSYRFERQVVRAAQRLGIPAILRGELTDFSERPRGWMSRMARDWYLKRFYSRISRFCYIGENARRHLERLGVAGDRMHFSPYSVDSRLFEGWMSSMDRRECRHRLGIGEDRFVFLFSGKLIPRKAPDLLLKALAALTRRDNVSVILLGDGVLRAEIETAARKLFGDAAIIPGFVNQSGLGQYFRSADAFVLPSHFETWGLVVNEAMHCGLPVIASSGVGCVPDLVSDGETGLIFAAGNSTELAGTLERMKSDPARARAMGEAARERVSRYRISGSVAGIRASLSLPASP